jgi:hypothetical protein
MRNPAPGTMLQGLVLVVDQQFDMNNMVCQNLLRVILG